MEGTREYRNWNYIDQLIYSFESFIYATSHKTDEIDVETMIRAETEHLRHENDELRKLQEPGRIVCSDEKYFCPHCKKQIPSEAVHSYKTKYCLKCGKRVILSIPYNYK